MKSEPEFIQKKINHVFHYTNNFDVLLKIIRNGFAPSYCLEKINDLEYFIPMTSFCNIPLKDVDHYMRYGKYGIGMSLEWAIKNQISPVIYVHGNTPYRGLHHQINNINLNSLTKKILDDSLKSIEEEESQNNSYSNEKKIIRDINDITITTLQFFKHWKTTYKNEEIVTYQEREWRYIPQLENEKRLITTEDLEFQDYKNKGFFPKPHLPLYSLQIDSISDLRYVVIKSEDQRQKIMNILNKKFESKKVVEAILSGKLMILSEEQIKNDF